MNHKPKLFDPARARETARRLREGRSAAPLFAGETKKAANDVVISSIGRASNA